VARARRIAARAGENRGVHGRCVADGKMFVDYYDPEAERDLAQVVSCRLKAIEQYIAAIKAFANDKVDDAINSGSFGR